jgi:hypothetical protein
MCLLSLEEGYETALQRRIDQIATPQARSAKAPERNRGSSAWQLICRQPAIRGRTARQRAVGDERNSAPDREFAQ